MLITCHGPGCCTKAAQAYYLVNGPRTGFMDKRLPLCDTCPPLLRAEGEPTLSRHLVEPVDGQQVRP